MAFVFPLNLTVPLVALPKPFMPETLMGKALSMESFLAAPAAALPSFHVIWSFITAEVFAERQPRLRWLWRGWAIAVAISCVTTGMHSILDVLTGVVTFFLVCQHREIWSYVRSVSERLANSWQEWRIGPVRLINYAIWAGLGGSCGLMIAICFAGPQSRTAILAAALVALATAGLWAQFVEGSPALLRPYGFYGGVAGAVLGALAAPLFGTDTWLVLGALSIAGPWFQALGRVRCLVQGCCHGRPASESAGIRYVHYRSRVCKLAALSGVPIHPTPVYSILWNIFIALFVTRLWFLGSALHLIAGIYLILTGLGRFVEEAYRGEPQTPYIGGLRLYQWIGIASVVAGAAITALGSGGSAPEPVWSVAAAPLAVAFGLLAALAMGVDLPEGQRRFSRLA
jgi:membrane-associated phospholipid phosphatase